MSTPAAAARPPAEPLHPQAAEFLQGAADGSEPPLHTLTPQAARAQVEAEVSAIGAGPPVASVSEIEIDVVGAAIRARVYAPAESLADIVWFHGGGWVLAGLDSHDAMCRMLANAARATVTSVEYRLAPEHRFPTPLEDCWEALRWVAARQPSRPLIVAGDSAGGNLAAVCALRARDRGGVDLTLQVLVYPVTDCDLSRPSYVEHGGEGAFLTAADMAWFFDHYVPDRAQRESAEVSPLRARALTGLPPAILVSAGHDPLLDEDLAYVARLREAGVTVVHRHYGDMPHAFFSFVNVFERGDEAVGQVAADVRSALSCA